MAAGITLNSGAGGNLIGGTGPGAGNVISGNGIDPSVAAEAASAIPVRRPPTESRSERAGRQNANTVEGNFIGTGPAGTGSVPNVGSNIVFNRGSSQNDIGGTASGAGNVIANSQRGQGIQVKQISNPTDNSLLGNRMFGNAGSSAYTDGATFETVSNSGLGIHLSTPHLNGPLVNDDSSPPFDTDSGANDRQNPPLLEEATASSTQTTVDGTLKSQPGTYRVEVFSNSAWDPRGHGEGEHFLGGFAAAVSGDGTATFSRTVAAAPAGDTRVTATATEADGSTSEFSACVPIERQDDSDGDGVPDSIDNCSAVSNPGQANNDRDAQGDACDPNDDNDARSDTADACPKLAASTANGCPHFSRSLTLGYSSGRSAAGFPPPPSRSACFANKTVTVWRKVGTIGGPDDVRVGQDATSSTGVYVLPRARRPGSLGADVLHGR